MRLGYIDTTTNLQILLNTAKLSHPEKYFPNFLTQKSHRIENSTSHKSLDLLCHLKSGVAKFYRQGWEGGQIFPPPPPSMSYCSLCMIGFAIIHLDAEIMDNFTPELLC